MICLQIFSASLSHTDPQCTCVSPHRQIQFHWCVAEGRQHMADVCRGSLCKPQSRQRNRRSAIRPIKIFQVHFVFWCIITECYFSRNCFVCLVTSQQTSAARFQPQFQRDIINYWTYCRPASTLHLMLPADNAPWASLQQGEKEEEIHYVTLWW